MDFNCCRAPDFNGKTAIWEKNSKPAFSKFARFRARMSIQFTRKLLRSFRVDCAWVAYGFLQKVCAKFRGIRAWNARTSRASRHGVCAWSFACVALILRRSSRKRLRASVLGGPRTPPFDFAYFASPFGRNKASRFSKSWFLRIFEFSLSFSDFLCIPARPTSGKFRDDCIGVDTRR